MSGFCAVGPKSTSGPAFFVWVHGARKIGEYVAEWIYLPVKWIFNQMLKLSISCWPSWAAHTYDSYHKNARWILNGHLRVIPWINFACSGVCHIRYQHPYHHQPTAVRFIMFIKLILFTPLVGTIKSLIVYGWCMLLAFIRDDHFIRNPVTRWSQ